MAEFELHEDKRHNADVRIDDAEEHDDSVECLIEDDAPFGGRTYFGSHLIFQESCMLCIPPTSEENAPKQEQIKPVHAHGNAIRDKNGLRAPSRTV